MFFLKTMAGLTGLAVLAFGGSQIHETKKVVALNNGSEHNITVDYVADGDERQMTLNLNGEALTPDLEGMEVGDIRTLTTSGGTEVTIERKDEHRYLLHGGEGEINIIIGGHDDGHGEHVWVHGDEMVHEIGDEMVFVTGAASDSVTISGLSDLDEDQKQRIIDALRAAGIDKDVQFMDTKIQMHQVHGDGAHHVWVDADGETHTGLKNFKFVTGQNGGDDGEVIIIKQKPKKN